jgi:proteasome lid subunit RPN8/RPN11
MTEKVQLPRALINQLLHHAQQSPVHEVCGLLGARDGVPVHCYPVANVAADPQRLFAMDPAQQIAALRTLRERGEELFAIYHSHPTTPPQPSAIDLAQARYPEALYLIISLQTQGVLEMRGFRLRGGVVSEVALETGA